MFLPNLKSVASPVPEIGDRPNSDWSLVLVGLRTPNLGEEEAVGVGMVPFERASVSSYFILL